MISEFILKLQKKIDLTYDEMNLAMEEMFRGNTTYNETIKFLSYLAEKKETDDELLGMLDKMKEFSLKINPENKEKLIDMCGTGGDKLQTFNISTTASFVVAAAGGIVAKHGNRSSSGILGSADIFEYFGYDLNQEPTQITKMLEKHRICFMFAQKFHPAMKHVSNARKQLGKRTAFNLLGPLSNPAGVKNQLIGIFSTEYLERLPLLLKKRGSQNIMTVSSDDGTDEFSTSAINHICFLKDNQIVKETIDAKKIGLHSSNLQDIKIQTKEEALRSFVKVLDNTANQAMIETTALNAAGGLVVAGISDNFEDAIEISLNTIKDGKAYKLLEKFVEDTGEISKLDEMRV